MDHITWFISYGPYYMVHIIWTISNDPYDINHMIWAITYGYEDLNKSVYCGIYGSTPSDDSNCDAFNKPSQSQPCSIKCPSQCLFTEWSNWSRCAPDNCDNPSNINYKYGFRQRIRQRIEPNIDPDTGTSMFYLKFFNDFFFQSSSVSH